MRVLVTGATGLIGSAIARRLAAAGHDVVGLARSDASATKLTDLGYQAMHGDLADAASLAEAARAVDAVVHAASPSDQNTAAYDEAATRVIIDALRGTSKRFVYTSGCLVYGATGDTPATEDSALHPIELVRFRQALEAEILGAVADGVHPVVIRPAWVFGDYGGTAMMMYASAKEHGAARYVGDGQNRWTCVHADDLADLYLLALKKAPAASIFNGAHGPAIPLIEIARAMALAPGAGWRNGRWTRHGRCFGALRTRSRAISWSRANWPNVSLAGARRGTRSSTNCAPTPQQPHSPELQPVRCRQTLKEC